MRFAETPIGSYESLHHDAPERTDFEEQLRLTVPRCSGRVIFGEIRSMTETQDL